MSFTLVMLKIVGTKTAPGVEDLYSNTPGDMGGESICGISRVKNPGVPVWAHVDRLKAADTPQADWWDDHGLMGAVLDFYQSLWLQHRLDQVPELLQGPVFGGIVNQGVQVVIDLQQCLQLLHQMLVVDGVMGPGTIAALGQVEPSVLVAFLFRRRTQGYLAIVDKHPDQRINFHGWICRLAAGL
jgi:lysozyme family protein